MCSLALCPEPSSLRHIPKLLGSLGSVCWQVKPPAKVKTQQLKDWTRSWLTAELVCDKWLLRAFLCALCLAQTQGWSEGIQRSHRRADIHMLKCLSESTTAQHFLSDIQQPVEASTDPKPCTEKILPCSPSFPLHIHQRSDHFPLQIQAGSSPHPPMQ